MASYRVISADSHVMEPPDLWTDRVEPKFRDHAPRVVREEDGDWWYCGDMRVIGMSSGIQAGLRFDEPEKLQVTAEFEKVRLGGYVPEEQIKDMEEDQVDVNILYPSTGLNLYSVEDSELLTGLFRPYNDWLAEFCRPYPDKLRGIAMLNTDDVPGAIMEMERCAKLGFVGAMITVFPSAERPYDSPVYEAFWAAAQDLEMPLSLHTATNRPGPGQELATISRIGPAFFVNLDHWVRMSLCRMIMSGVFERYPKLQVGAVEHELSWVPHFLDRMDYTYTQRSRRDYWHRFKDDTVPSDYFHRNVFVGFQEDSVGIRLRDVIGVDNLQWGSDYPHPESTFPRTRQILEEILADCTEEEKAKIAGGNAARVYHLD